MNKNAVFVPEIFGGLGIIIIITLVWSILTYNIFFNSEIEPFELETWTKGIDWAFLIFTAIIEMIFLRILIKDNRVIIIKEDKVIFKSWVLPIFSKMRKKTFYDGYILVSETNRYGNVYQAMYLIRNGRITDRISSFYYKNFDSIVNSLDIKFLGRRKISFIKQLLVGLGVKVRY